MSVEMERLNKELAVKVELLHNEENKMCDPRFVLPLHPS